MHTIDLGALVTFNPWMLSPESTLRDAIRLVGETDTTCWPVVDADGKLVGLVSEAELLSVLRAESPLDGAVSAFMEPEPHWLDISQGLDASLEKVLASRARLAPVVDHGRVIGTLAAADFLREISYGADAIARELVLDVMQRAGDGLDSDLTPSTALAHLREANLAAMAVVQADFPVGAVTRRSLVRYELKRLAAARANTSASEPTLGQLLQASPTLAPGRTLGEAAATMVENNLDGLAVVNHAAHLLGIITDDMILCALQER